MKKFSEILFGKQSDEITFEDVEAFFQSEKEESSVLEFKTGDVEIISLYKEICAFLNTEGGLIIVGSPRESKIPIGKHEKIVCKGNLTYSKFSGKDWIYQKVMSNVVPAPVQISVKEFIKPNGSVFLIDVPQSLHPPHQSDADGRYYIRMDREAKPAPHGLIKALFDKRRVPVLEGKINSIETKDYIDEVEFILNNNSKIPAENVGFNISLFNINDVECMEGQYFRKIKQDEFQFSFLGNLEQILVKPLSIPIKLKIKHFNRPYQIICVFWSKESGSEQIMWKINPYGDEIEEFDSKSDEIILLSKKKIQDSFLKKKEEVQKIFIL